MAAKIEAEKHQLSAFNMLSILCASSKIPEKRACGNCGIWQR
jgi:hypothetical protein